MDDLRARLEKALEDTYIFERELGGGGMSRTYLVRERALDRRVVVKVLAPELLAGISVERFRREVMMAAKLQHPHVVPVLTTGDVDGLPWFSMPYVDGDSLRQRLGRGALPITEIIGILRDVARALAYAHANGIVHRDIKPDNVLLSTGSATVTDFGIAKAISAARTGGDGSAPNTMLTVTGTSIGTPAATASPRPKKLRNRKPPCCSGNCSRPISKATCNASTPAPILPTSWWPRSTNYAIAAAPMPSGSRTLFSS